MKWLKTPWILLGLCVLTCLVYARGLWGPFLWDDEVMVLINPMITQWSSVGDIFQSAAFGGSASSGKFYRPIQIFSFLLDHQLYGMKAWGFHLSSLLYHLLTVVLAFFLGRSLFLLCKLGENKARLAGALFALILAIHPINIEAVTYISGRGDMLNLLMVVLATFAFIKAMHELPQFALLAVAAYVAGILAKENIVMLPFMLAVMGVIFGPSCKRPFTWRVSQWPLWMWTVAVQLAVFASYMGYRLFGTRLGGEPLSTIAEASLLEQVLTLPWILWTYLRLFVLPHPLHMEYLTVIHTVLDPVVFLGVPLGLLLMWVLLFKTKGVMRQLSVLAVAWFLLGLAPVLHIPFPLASTIREHWASIPFIGLYWVLVFVCVQVSTQMPPAKRQFFTGIFAIWLLFLGLATANRVGDWTSDQRLYLHDLKYEPRSFLLHNNLGLTYFRQGDLDKAGASFQQSILVSPGESYGIAFNNLGVVLERKGDTLTASKLYLRSIDLSRYHLAYGNLARVLLQSNELDAAEKILTQGLDWYPKDPELNRMQWVLSKYKEVAYKNKR